MAAHPLRALPLRVTLVATMLLLVVCGLLASGIAVTSILRHSLISRVDERLIDASSGWAQEPRQDVPDQGFNPARPPSNFFVQGVDRRGDVWIAINDRKAQPALLGNSVGPVPMTIGSIDDSPVMWRAMSVRGPDDELITIAVDLSEVQDTVRALVLLQLAIGSAVLLVLGVLGYWVVHRSLQPLVEVEKTAVAIAAGQLESRVPQGEPNTEVGQLALALNVMLSQIQGAMAESAASAETARRSEERMRRFITDASHELRTPLTTIRGFAELYRQGASTSVEMSMSRIESESKRMSGLVEDLLLLAQLDAQRPLERQHVDLFALASDAVHDAKSTTPNRSIALEFVEGPGMPEVLGDEGRLRQVLGNLVANALQHTPADTVVTVRVGTEGDAATLEVADQGPGMHPQDAERIFERFYRADSSRTRASGGAGLGLSIVDSLVRASGGRVSVMTAPGAGCCFRVTLPRICAGVDLSSVQPVQL